MVNGEATKVAAMVSVKPTALAGGVQL